MKGRGIILAMALGLSVSGSDLPSEEDARFFEEKVRPLLELKCFECHSHQSGKIKGGLTLDSRSGWSAGGDSGPAIVPGNVDTSRLIRAVRRTEEDLKMPPKEALTAGEVSLLEEWVRRGAPDPRQAPVASKADAVRPVGDWWSLRPLVRPALPEGSQHPIDAFISARLRAESITPAPEADRRTLLRRLSFDLHGLPPSPEEVDRFVGDTSSEAYDHGVDHLLASPRYGERWARHWLDSVHFADTHGFEHDLIRTNAWRYRDYVVESLNRDTPWARFIREQLAADVFYPEEPRLTPALGFLGAGPWDHSTAQTAPRTLDNLDRDDMVTQTMSTFASATVHCARCHDHKFDPISQEDYYSLQSVFAGVGKGDLSYDDDPGLSAERRRWKALLVAAQSRDRDRLLSGEADAKVASWESQRPPEATWEVLRPEVFLSASAAKLKPVEDGSLRSEGTRPDTDTYTVIAAPTLREISAIRLELLADATLPKKGPGRQDNGNMHLSEFEVRVTQPGQPQGDKLAIGRATSDFDQSGWTIQHAIDGKTETAWGLFPRVGETHVSAFVLATPLVLSEGARLVIQLKQLHGQGHVIGRFRLSVTRDPPTRVTVVPLLVAEALRRPPEQRTEEDRLAIAAHVLQGEAETRLAALPPASQVFGAGPDFTAVTEGGFYKPWKEPKPVHLLQRGDIDKPGAVSSPGAISAITALPGRFALAHPGAEGERRAALADWLVNHDNPLTWRSIVNRVWHYHFGRGLSDSPNDFGRMGSPPTHPELLDWLACEFRDSGGSLKALHRLIVTSAAYRRAARHDEAAFARDPDNRLLWRRQSQRLDAESYRDFVIAVSGRQDLTMGGPGVQQFKLGKPIQLTPTVDYAPFEWSQPGAGRRSVYRFVYRGIPDPFMDSLDFPDAAQLAPQRPFSSSALQTLALLNNDFVLFHSQQFAARLQSLASDPAQQIQEAFRLAFQRNATSAEDAEFTTYAVESGLASACRVLFNSNEFLFVN